MTDHEMCLAAARAAGYTVESYDADCIKHTVVGGLTGCWNPLEYDEDAFRLMVDCGIGTEPRDYMKTVFADSGYGDKTYSEPYGTDKHAATRRAITRAAAAMGHIGSSTADLHGVGE